MKNKESSNEVLVGPFSAPSLHIALVFSMMWVSKQKKNNFFKININNIGYIKFEVQLE